MIFLSDIKKLFSLCNDRYAVMCVKHNHIPEEHYKMDGREQLKYSRKNWSSFVLWNCGHSLNRQLTKERVNFMPGRDLHAFSWLDDAFIGSIPFTYNFISGVSPKMAGDSGGRPDVLHYTNGGPWFDECKDVPYAGTWMEEYEDWQANGDDDLSVTAIRSIAFEPLEVIRK